MNTTKRICYTIDGHFVVVIPAMAAMSSTETEATFVDRLRATRVPASATLVHVCSTVDLPPTREFRDAWRFNAIASTGAVEDVSAAAQTQIARIEEAKGWEADRLAREEFMLRDVTAEKAALLAIDASALLANASTIEDVRAAWPSTLVIIQRG